MLMSAVLITNPALADEETLSQQIVSSADQLPGSFSAITETSDHKIADNIESFFSKGKLNLRLRNYYIDEKEQPNSSDSTWAQGGSLRWSSGKFNNFATLNAELFFSTKLYLPEGSDGGGLLSEDGANYLIPGVINPQLDFGGHKLSLYRQKINLAYVNQHDSRMTPNTFEAYLLKKDNESKQSNTYEYVLGYINKMRPRNSDSFSYMSEIAGAENADSGTGVLGARYHITPTFTLGAVNYYNNEALNIFYSESEFKKKLSSDWGLKLGLQYSRQDTLGDNQNRDDYYTGFAGAQSAISYKGTTFYLAYNKNQNGGDLTSPFGSYPSYTSLIVEDFSSAGAQTWMTGLSFNLERLGIKDLSFSVLTAHSSSTATTGNYAAENESDLGFDYKFSSGILKDLSLRLRAAIVNNENQPQQEEYRAILNYDFSLYSGEK